MLNNCKKGKIFLGKHAIYDWKLWKLVLIVLNFLELVAHTLHTLRNFQVSEGEKNEGLENNVFKTYVRRSIQDVHKTFFSRRT